MITREEYGWLNIYRSEGFRWIARDKNKGLYVYTTEPEKRECEWRATKPNSNADYIKEGYRLFPNVKWEDEKPTKILDLMQDYESHQVITDETVKVTVPQYIADWILEVKALERTFKLEILFDTDEMPEDVFDWLDERYGDTDILAKAWLDGFEIEQEKLYYIEFSENQYAQRFDESNIDSILVNDKALAGRFTEEQIKKINPRFWLLAVEVE